MEYELTDDYLAEARKRAYRYQGQWCGTSGSLAADVARLLIERKKMQGFITDLEPSNAALREAVETRLAGGCCDGGKCQPRTVASAHWDNPEMAKADATERWNEITQASAEKYAAEREEQIPADWILQGQREMEAAQDDVRWTGDSILAEEHNDIRPGSREFLAVLDELRTLHLRKTMDYGVDEDALSNIRSSADVVNMPAWAGCILRISDKMHRLKAFFRRGRCEFDGVEDTLKDIACYAAIALVLHREQGQAEPV